MHNTTFVMHLCWRCCLLQSLYCRVSDPKSEVLASLRNCPRCFHSHLFSVSGNVNVDSFTGIEQQEFIFVDVLYGFSLKEFNNKIKSWNGMVCTFFKFLKNALFSFPIMNWCFCSHWYDLPCTTLLKWLTTNFSGYHAYS